MRNSKQMFVVAAVTLGVLPITACAASITFLGSSATPSDVSGDGSVVVGNIQGTFETFRWTQSTGVVPLGRATVPVIGTGAGTPDVSWDGTKISATIMDDTNTAGTAGRWTQGAGWQQLMPPTPPTGGIVDSYYGSAWGMSGDGNTVTGLYWRPGQTDGIAHALRWKEGVGPSGLGSDGGSSRANGANFDGSVIVGWDEHPSFGVWRPTVWENGVKTVLAPNLDAFSSVKAADEDGSTIAGSLFNHTTNINQASIWRKTGGTWVAQDVGVLPGTAPNFGNAEFEALSADGTAGVGFNRFGGGFGNGTGFYWSEATGLISGTQLLTSLGLSLPPGHQLFSFTSISADGSTIGGISIENGAFQGFVINNIPEPGAAVLLGLGLPALIQRRRRRN